MPQESSKRLVVVSNRLPASLKQVEGEWTVQPGSGGLVTAIAPVLKNRGGLWIGWSGGHGDVDLPKLLGDFSKDAGYDLHPVQLTEEEVRGYYYGFANEIIWPLFHDFQSRCNFDPSYWRDYLDVNLKFAEVTARYSRESDYIWVHDYHLMHLAFMLRNMGIQRSCGFFLHIPFPPPDIYLKLPWRDKILRALLEFDLVGFQTLRDRRNFVECMEALVPNAKCTGRGNMVTIEHQNRKIRAGGFPISIDFNQFASLSADKDVVRMADEFKDALRHRKIILGVDRLDYTKGIPQRLEAIRQLFIRFPDLREKVTFVQIAVPSREEIPEYHSLKVEIEQLVGEINGQFTRPGWIPIHYQYRNLPRPELVSYYRAADMALITPLRDGLNLVAKEYCAANVNENGVLFLSEFAGAAAQLQNAGAILVNPYDTEGVAKAIRRAYYMDKRERHTRMSKLRESVRRNNIYWWVDSFLQAAFSSQLEDFPQDTVDFQTESTST
ncbi:alpha,alpha-trehalose-phosphate synthase (UDP-forming) [Desulfohalovibrio reitneri]|uniref:alpha,alpha-trehalose-phosphate synthase (UDP-forming) n=1 Tax=Desulfohalovibrio reitneri TaxID=1307759 RepID=UPI0004A74883|nr:trehalose-6-phosphate synthase [Desulfohalovibrio reitneri]